jgi:hypothetical protein
MERETKKEEKKREKKRNTYLGQRKVLWKDEERNPSTSSGPGIV